MDIPSWLYAEAECLGEIMPREKCTALSAAQIRRALTESVREDSADTRPPLASLKRGRGLCLVVSDHTRQTGAHRILPVLLDLLCEHGCGLEDISLLVAGGIHRASRPDEIRRLVGAAPFDALRGRIFNHDADDDANLVTVGRTETGHTVRLNRRAVEADGLVLIGTASYHYHAGFGGGRKSLVPGLAARETIAYTHSLTLDPAQDRLHPSVAPGVLDGNPVSMAMLECARLHPPTFIVNSVLDPAGELVGLFSGELDAAHRAACRQVEQVCRADVARPADFVIASAGDASNWIQSHKALYNAHRAIRPGGRVVLLAPCPEGLGNDRFRYWLTRPNLTELYRELRLTAEVNGQTALSTRLRGTAAILVTGLPQADTRALGIATAPDLGSALRRVVDELGAANRKPAFYLMPTARHLTPFSEECPISNTDRL